MAVTLLTTCYDSAQAKQRGMLCDGHVQDLDHTQGYSRTVWRDAYSIEQTANCSFGGLNASV